MQKFIDIIFILIVVIVIITLIAMLLGFTLNKQQLNALMAFGFGGFLSVVYRTILKAWEEL